MHRLWRHDGRLHRDAGVSTISLSIETWVDDWMINLVQMHQLTWTNHSQRTTFFQNVQTIWNIGFGKCSLYWVWVHNNKSHAACTKPYHQQPFGSSKILWISSGRVILPYKKNQLIKNQPIKNQQHFSCHSDLNIQDVQLVPSWSLLKCYYGLPITSSLNRRWWWPNFYLSSLLNLYYVYVIIYKIKRQDLLWGDLMWSYFRPEHGFNWRRRDGGFSCVNTHHLFSRLAPKQRHAQPSGTPHINWRMGFDGLEYKLVRKQFLVLLFFVHPWYRVVLIQPPTGLGILS